MQVFFWGFFENNTARRFCGRLFRLHTNPFSRCCKVTSPPLRGPRGSARPPLRGGSPFRARGPIPRARAPRRDACAAPTLGRACYPSRGISPFRGGRGCLRAKKASPERGGAPVRTLGRRGLFRSTWEVSPHDDSEASLQTSRGNPSFKNRRRSRREDPPPPRSPARSPSGPPCRSFRPASGG